MKNQELIKAMNEARKQAEEFYKRQTKTDESLIKEFQKISGKIEDNPAALQACKDFVAAMDYLDHQIDIIEKNRRANERRFLDFLKMKV